MLLDARLRTGTLLLPVLFLAGCDLAGDILEFGFWTGVILVAVIVLLIWGLMRMIRGRPRT